MPRRREKKSIFDRNELLEVEATHSGDEVDAGTSDGEGIANSSDIDFLVDQSGTQASSDYDQGTVYRQGLSTQVPTGGPQFTTKPIRNGFLGRRRSTQVRQQLSSSSPIKNDDDLDQYSLGSFVVPDDDDILEEESSEP
jgi:ATP-dependent DNA helicase MPH1